MAISQGYKLIITYNYLSGRELAYRRFMIHQWLPAMQTLGLEPLELYHTMWGAYPVRLVTLYAANETILRRALGGSEWRFWWGRLHDFVTDLEYCILPARGWFQFCPNA